ncbi:unnamed protein product [Microthlaspi erraticum]|uniref:RRM domain-containing protein n=1 Tax=Microthlaspi erraticum TaxID=1685480 RepID=A0A6D2K8S9_9BRAS|nr:unnamed protein product [Microthlaspi erraticum]
MDESAAAEVIFFSLFVLLLTGMQSKEAVERCRFDEAAKGFDVSVPENCMVREHVLCLEGMLRDHFSSCGKIKSVCIPHAYDDSTIKRCAYIEISGKGSEEEALKLSGSEMDGQKLVVTRPSRPMKKARRKSLKSDRYGRSKSVIVRGYDSSLPRKIIKSALGKHFSSCGEVLEVALLPNQSYPKEPEFVASSCQYAYVSIYGKCAKDKALELTGSDMGGFKLVVEKSGCHKRQAGDKPLRILGCPPPSKYFTKTLKTKENPNTNKRKENPNPNSNEKKKKKKKRKTSK